MSARFTELTPGIPVIAVSILLRRFQPCAFETTAQMPAL